MNSKTSSKPDDSPPSTKDGVNDGLSSSSSNRNNRNHEVNDNDDDGDEVFADEVGASGPSFLDEAFAFFTSFVVSLSSFVAARAKELKKLNVNVII